jgi:betaine-aldehyde dehydrogenase
LPSLAPVPHPDELFIGGAWTAPAAGGRAPVVNPSTGAVIAELADAGPADIDRAVAAARAAFDRGPWPELSVEERTAALRRFTDALKVRTPAINETWGAECGATVGWQQGLHDLAAPMMFEAAFAEAAATPLVERRDGPFGPAEIRREPFGVAACIITYNGPLAYIGFKVLPALLAGNTAVLKLPPEVRALGHWVAEAVEAAELPPGVLSVVTAGADASRHLVEHPDVDIVSFTGGTAVGRQILRSTAERIAPCTLELGGKCAGIVADDIPLEQLLPALVPGLVAFQGQVCVALTRVLVSGRRHDEVVGGLVEAFKALSIGDVADPEVTFGPVAVERTRDRCEASVARAVADGATVAHGGRRPSGLDRGWFYEPTLLTGVTNDMAVARDEVFGPVFTVIRYDDIDDAVRIANDSPYGLSGAIFTNDGDLALGVARRIRAGSFTTNTVGGAPGHPFGGYKQSGIGREMGPEGYLEWLQTKSISLASTLFMDH